MVNIYIQGVSKLIGKNLWDGKKHLNKQFVTYNAWTKSKRWPLEGAETDSIKQAFSYAMPFLSRISASMTKYNNQGKLDMYFMYGMANSNALESPRLYKHCYPRRHFQTDKCSSDWISDCVKRDPSSPTCIIQDLIGMCNGDEL